jgi:hypothetical protein
MLSRFLGWLVLCLAAAPFNAPAAPRLKVSENHRFLVTTDGQPFF